MAYNSFNDADQLTLLTNPGVFSYRPYGSLPEVPFKKAVFANGAAYSIASETIPTQFDDVGDVTDVVSKMTAEISLSSGRVLDLDFLAAISGGLFKVTNTVGTLVPSATLSVTSGNWAYNKFILLPGQNATGAKQTIASVVGSVNTDPFVNGTDYDQVFFPEVGWGIIISDSSYVTTLSQSIVVTYAYTPAGVKKMSMGGAKHIEPLEIKFETENSAGKIVTYNFYKCFPSGNMGHGFSPENSAEPATIDLTFTAKCDTTRSGTDLDQLASIEITE